MPSCISRLHARVRVRVGTGSWTVAWVGRYSWSNQMVPESNWDDKVPWSQRRYWGWNEVPMDRVKIHNVQFWDAVVIKLPAAICGHNGVDDRVACLSYGAQQQLEKDLWAHINKQLLVPGWSNVVRRPGSYVVFLKVSGSDVALSFHHLAELRGSLNLKIYRQMPLIQPTCRNLCLCYAGTN